MSWGDEYEGGFVKCAICGCRRDTDNMKLNDGKEMVCADTFCDKVKANAEAKQPSVEEPGTKNSQAPDGGTQAPGGKLQRKRRGCYLKRPAVPENRREVQDKAQPPHSPDGD